MSFAENLSKVGQIVGRVAPLLGNAFINPVGSAIGIVEEVAKAFGGDANDPDDFLQKINADPQSMIKLIEIQSQNRLALENINVEKERIAADDRNSARQKEKDMAASGHRDWVPPIIAIGFLIIYAAVQLYIVYEPNSQSDDIISARLQDVVIIIIGYYFGSSASSRKKDELIANVTKK